ncbi:MAG: ABC transporter permease, partial [Gemmatimonadaceae bacterium]
MHLPFANRRAHMRQRHLNVSLLDFKLGVRMFAKYPGLSFASVLGMAIAIAIGASVFSGVRALIAPTLPLAEGDRVVAVQTVRADVSGSIELQVLHDFVTWQTELTTVRELGAFQLNNRNLIVGDQVTDVVPIAEMSASGFRVARVLPLMGRTLVEDDDRINAPPVLVIGQREWHRYFDGDPSIIGRNVRFNETTYTVVGVMPEDFRFPRNHGFWVPFQVDPSKYEVGDGPPIEVFGRLAQGVTFEQASAQVTMIGKRLISAYPKTHEFRRPTVLPFARASSLTAVDPALELQLYLIQFGATLLLTVVAVNVAVLVYARTATRATEIAVRTALGASRSRVITQLFIEALFLSGVAAIVGLSIAAFALRWIESVLAQGQEGLPFWFHLKISPALITYVIILAVVGGAVVGILPGLRATRHAFGGLQQLSARGSSMRLGSTWTALIVVQVAMMVAILPASIYHASVLLRAAMVDPGYPAEQFVRARISLG